MKNERPVGMAAPHGRKGVVANEDAADARGPHPSAARISNVRSAAKGAAKPAKKKRR